jgi:hypothetical protein
VVCAAMLCPLALSSISGEARQAAGPDQPTRVGVGRSIQFAAARGRVWAAYTRKAPGGYDLMLGEIETGRIQVRDRIRVNDVPGEVRDTNENSPVLLVSHDRSALFLIWIGADSRHRLANRLRFARVDLTTMRASVARTINDDAVRATHSFHRAAVAPNGDIHVVWLDRRHNDRGGPKDYPGGGDPNGPREVESALYTSTSADGGLTFAKNRRIASAACACCRPAIAATERGLVVAWRGVAPGDVRDILLSRSADGVTWSPAQTAWRDGWVIGGCPHAGPALIARNGAIHLAWLTGANGRPELFFATSHDNGVTFASRQQVSGAIDSSSSPVLTSVGDRVTLLFHGSLAGQRSATFRRQLSANGTLDGPSRMSSAGRQAHYPAAIGVDGRVITGWLDRSGEAPTLFVRQLP